MQRQRERVALTYDSAPGTEPTFTDVFLRGICSVNPVILKVELKGIPESYLPSLATSCENMASNSERIMEKSGNFQIIYAGPTNLFQHSTTDLLGGTMTNERKQSLLSKARSFKHSKTTSSFLYSIY